MQYLIIINVDTWLFYGLYKSYIWEQFLLVSIITVKKQFDFYSLPSQSDCWGKQGQVHRFAIGCGSSESEMQREFWKVENNLYIY